MGIWVYGYMGAQGVHLGLADYYSKGGENSEENTAHSGLAPRHNLLEQLEEHERVFNAGVPREIIRKRDPTTEREGMFLGVDRPVIVIPDDEEPLPALVLRNPRVDSILRVAIKVLLFSNQPEHAELVESVTQDGFYNHEQPLVNDAIAEYRQLGQENSFNDEEYDLEKAVRYIIDTYPGSAERLLRQDPAAQAAVLRRVNNQQVADMMLVELAVCVGVGVFYSVEAALVLLVISLGKAIMNSQ